MLSLVVYGLQLARLLLCLSVGLQASVLTKSAQLSSDWVVGPSAAMLVAGYILTASFWIGFAVAMRSGLLVLFVWLCVHTQGR